MQHNNLRFVHGTATFMLFVCICNSLSRYRATVIERISHCVSQKAGDTRFACFSDLAVWHFSDALQRMVQLVIEALDNA